MSRSGNFRRRTWSVVSRLTVALWMVLVIASPGLAGVAVIEATAPLLDHSEQSIRTAVMAAVTTAARGALAMGLPWIQLGPAQVIGETLTIQILATDAEPDRNDEMQPAPSMKPGMDPGQAQLFDL